MPELRNVYLQTLVDVAASVGPPVGSRPVTDPSTRQCPAPAGSPRCGWLETEIVREYEQIREAALADPRSPHTDEAFEESVEFLKRFARERGDVVRSYVAALTPELVEPPPSSDSLRFRSLPVRRPR